MARQPDPDASERTADRADRPSLLHCMPRMPFGFSSASVTRATATAKSSGRRGGSRAWQRAWARGARGDGGGTREQAHEGWPQTRAPDREDGNKGERRGKRVTHGSPMDAGAAQPRLEGRADRMASQQAGDGSISISAGISNSSTPQQAKAAWAGWKADASGPETGRRDAGYEAAQQTQDKTQQTGAEAGGKHAVEMRGGP